MAQLQLDTETKKIVTIQLEKLNMQDYQEQVELMMLGEEAPGMVLRLINNFYVTGRMRGKAEEQVQIGQRLKAIIEGGK